jgi:hypothetical protein
VNYELWGEVSNVNYLKALFWNLPRGAEESNEEYQSR